MAQKEEIIEIAREPEVKVTSVTISSLIHIIRGKQVILDSKSVYHIGASIKDAGKKCFGISLWQDVGMVQDLLNRLSTV